jgi:hypothetical protein
MGYSENPPKGTTMDDTILTSLKRARRMLIIRYEDVIAGRTDIPLPLYVRQRYLDEINDNIIKLDIRIKQRENEIKPPEKKSFWKKLFRI